MNTGNFATKINERRIGAHSRLLVRRHGFLDSIKDEEEKMAKLDKALRLIKANGPGSKELKDEIEQCIRTIKNINEEVKPMNKELDILESRITTEEVARSKRTKKDRRSSGRRRSIFN